MIIDADPNLPKAPRWVWLTLLVDVVIFGIVAIMFAFLSADTPTLTRFIYVAVWMIPYFGLAVLMRTRPSVFAYAATIAVAVESNATILFLMAISSIPGDGQTAVLARLAVFFLGLLIVHVAVILSCGRALLRLGRDTTFRAVGLGLMFTVLWPAAAHAIAGAIGAPIEALQRRKKAHNEMALVRGALQVQRCALLYEARHPSTGFPSSLPALAEGQPGCLDREIARGATSGFTLAYQPKPRDGDGPVPGFVVRGQTRPVAVDPALLGVSGDERAVLRRFPRDSGDTSREMPETDGMPKELDGVRNCVEALKRERDRVPSRAELLASTNKWFDNALQATGCSLFGLRALGNMNNDSSYLATTRGYRLVYAPSEKGYRVEARPVKYAETALRSYVTTDIGDIHVTRNDRGATEDDDQLAACPPFDVGDCVPTPLQSPPRAAFVHDSVVRVDRAYWLHVRVSGAADRVPANLWWAFECDVRPEVAPVTPTHFRNSEPDQSCAALASRQPAIGDSVTVRLWLRNAPGVVSHEDAVARVEKHAPVYASPFMTPQKP